jgi:hypothetical protein
MPLLEAWERQVSWLNFDSGISLMIHEQRDKCHWVSMSAPQFSGPINGEFLQPWIQALRYGHMANEPQSRFLGFPNQNEADAFWRNVNWAFWIADVGSINSSVSPYRMFQLIPADTCPASTREIPGAMPQWAKCCKRQYLFLIN